MSLPTKYIPLLIAVIFALLLFLSSTVLFSGLSEIPSDSKSDSMDCKQNDTTVLAKGKLWEKNVETFVLDDGNIIQWIASKYYHTMVESAGNKFQFHIIKKVPSQLQNVVIYALTASDPCDTKQSDELNTIANKKLYGDLLDLDDPEPMKIEGFGFRVWYNATIWTTTVDQKMIGLGRKYRQAAIYKWYSLADGRIIHQVLSCFDSWRSAESSNVVKLFMTYPRGK